MDAHLELRQRHVEINEPPVPARCAMAFSRSARFPRWRLPYPDILFPAPFLPPPAKASSPPVPKFPAACSPRACKSTDPHTSTKSMPSVLASTTPTVLFPLPGIPISTIFSPPAMTFPPFVLQSRLNLVQIPQAQSLRHTPTAHRASPGRRAAPAAGGGRRRAPGPPCRWSPRRSWHGGPCGCRAGFCCR